MAGLNSSDIMWNIDAPDNTTATTTFFMTAFSTLNTTFDVNNPCVRVDVGRLGYNMYIVSTGYNTCNTAAVNRVSRSVTAYYY